MCYNLAYVCPVSQPWHATLGPARAVGVDAGGYIRVAGDIMIPRLRMMTYHLCGSRSAETCILTRTWHDGCETTRIP